MKEAKPHPIIAGICDFYFIFFVIGSVLVLFNLVFQTTYQIYLVMTLGMFPIALLIVIFYYMNFASKTMFLTPGEAIGGRVIVNKTKKWTNPYNKNRFFLFFTLMLTIIVYNNAWDSLSEGTIMPLSQWLFTNMALGLVLVGSKLAGKGCGSWLPIIILPSVLNILVVFVFQDQLYGNLPTNSQNVFTNTMIGIYTVLILLSIAAYLIYNVFNKKIDNLKN